MVDTANFTIYIRQWAQAQATSDANTTALWREAIQGGEAFSLKHPLNVYNYSGSGNIPSGDLAKVGAAEVFVYEIGGQRAPLLKVTGDDTMTQFSSAPIVESGDPSSGEPLKIHYMSVEVNLSTGTVKTDIVPISGSGGTSNVIHGENITEGLEYLIPENVGDVVAFRSTMDSSQVPAEQEGFGFLAKVNGSESMAMMMQNDPAGGGKMKFFMGRVQNDGSGTEWQELTTGSSSEIFPGWKRIVSSWSSAVGPSGTSGIINFNQEIPTTSKILIEATIQSNPATAATIKFPVPLTVAAINKTGQGILFDICSMYLGSNSTPGSIKLICSSVITGANGVQGMNVVVQSNNLSGASDIIQIKGIYFKA